MDAGPYCTVYSTVRYSTVQNSILGGSRPGGELSLHQQTFLLMFHGGNEFLFRALL